MNEPENIRAGPPYDNPAFESLCREMGIWGTAQAALCAVFWRRAVADRAQQQAGQGAKPAHAVMMSAHALCPTDMAHPKRMAWIADYFLQNHNYTAPPARQEPYGWQVSGTRDLYTGLHAEISALADARRIGGTCRAFPLYTAPPPAQVPLSETQIAAVFDLAKAALCNFAAPDQQVAFRYAIVRAIESVHGIYP